MKTPTPELDKQKAVIDSGATRTLTDFVDWLSEQGYVIAHWQRFEDLRDPRLTPMLKSREQLFADFFGIDRDKIEAERRALLEELREKQS